MQKKQFELMMLASQNSPMGFGGGMPGMGGPPMGGPGGMGLPGGPGGF